MPSIAAIALNPEDFGLPVLATATAAQPLLFLALSIIASGRCLSTGCLLVLRVAVALLVADRGSLAGWLDRQRIVLASVAFGATRTRCLKRVRA